MERRKHTLADALGVIENSTLPGQQTFEQNWAEFQARLQKEKQLRLRTVLYRIAASVIVFIGIFAATLFFSQQKIKTFNGEQFVHELPDGSTVHLNSGSAITYNRLLWHWKRNLSLKGEAFFEVKKGSPFTVKSANGHVTVLGTSFNIFDREDRYNVSCFTGKVLVGRIGLKNITLEKGQRVTQDWKKQQFESTIAQQAWRNSSFAFSEVPLKNVFGEISRRYNYHIVGKYNADVLYSGNFKQYKIEKVLQLVCLPSHLTFTVDSVKRIIRISNAE